MENKTSCCSIDKSCSTESKKDTSCCTSDNSCKTESSCCDTKGSCGTKKSCCCIMKCLMAVLVAFAALMAFDWLFHGTIMMDSYKATAQLWRPVAEMQDFWWVCVVRNAVTAIIFACLFWCCASKCCGCPVKMGAKLGFKLGLLLGVAAFGSYAWLPISLNMALAWLAGETVKGVLVGSILGMLCHMKSAKN